jgi:hypothetical protein
MECEWWGCAIVAGELPDVCWCPVMCRRTENARGEFVTLRSGFRCGAFVEEMT